MKHPGSTSRSSLLLFAPAVGIGVTLAGAPAVHAAQPRTEPVVGWLHRHADPLRTVDPAVPLDDLAPLRRSIGDAAVVGLGESVHGAAELSRLKHRTLRLLVERMGFRSIAWEVDWTMGVRIDAYIREGEGDLNALMSEILPSYRTREVADVLRWLRDFNEGRADKVRFVGVEYFLTRPQAYDAVEAHVAAVAPRRLPEVRRHLDVIKPPPEKDMWQYIEWYGKVGDKDRYTRHARELRALVAGLPHRPDDRAHALALHRARQIVYFYEHFGLPEPDSHAYRDARAARNLKWWRGLTGDKVVYWAASPHTANAPKLRITRPPQQDMRFASAGSYLRRWYGGRYRSIGFTFDHGTVSTGGGTAVLPPPARDWFERPFGKVRTAQFTIDLREPAPPPVRRRLDAPIETRGLTHIGSGSFMSGGTLRQWFDVVVHRQVVTPGRPA
ncbi:hypothetical protein BJF79_37470 [Actinomadura sp. CNU-125]|uniref:erythromycin esterase family protein n=1 Tax=Actinomadura sp. CNU-125 TaxID=1904961 RepID=UPI000966915C|nr:erythromycin esterase family protein [Actinomadura sp. CNU-125]OLT31363.1 hypothetical protein BJF79_37470 [Actinomadura sp. CNU-125]